MVITTVQDVYDYTRPTGGGRRIDPRTLMNRLIIEQKTLPYWKPHMDDQEMIEGLREWFTVHTGTVVEDYVLVGNYWRKVSTIRYTDECIKKYHNGRLDDWHWSIPDVDDSDWDLVLAVLGYRDSCAIRYGDVDAHMSFCIYARSLLPGCQTILPEHLQYPAYLAEVTFMWNIEYVALDSVLDVVDFVGYCAPILELSKSEP